MFTHEITTSITIDAEPARVWAVLTDLAAHERWNPFFASMRGTLAVGERLEIAARKPDGTAGMRFRPIVLEMEEAARLVWRGRLVVPGLFTGTHRFLLTPTGDGRTHLEHGESFAGLAIAVSGSVMRDTEAGFEAFNRALADEVARRTTPIDAGC